MGMILCNAQGLRTNIFSVWVQVVSFFMVRIWLNTCVFAISH